MKIKTTHLKIAIFLAVFAFGFFGFGILSKAKAACNYLYVDFNTQGKTTVTPQDKINFTGIIAQQGTQADCSNPKYPLQMSFQTDDKFGRAIVIASNTNVQFTNGRATLNATLDLSKFDRAQLLDPNQIPFTFVVSDLSGTSYVNKTITIGITGSSSGTSGTGSLGLNIYFKPTDKSQFNNGDSLQILLHIGNVNNIPSNISSIYYQFWVNQTKLSGFNKKVPDEVKFDQHYDLTVNSQNGFKDGVNTVKVELWQSDTQVKITEVSAPLQATGLGTSGPSGSEPSTTNPPTGATVDCSGPNPDPNFCLYNPLPVNGLADILMLIMQAFLGIIGVWSVTFVVIGGFKYVMSQGNEEAVTSARKTITWAVLGLVIALLAFTIVTVVKNILQADVQQVGSITREIKG